MKEAIRPGDVLIVNRMACGYSRYSCPWSLCSFAGRVFASPPARGNIVVFAHPRSGVPCVKRIVGLPGERIRMQGGSGGLPVCANRPSGIGEICRKRRYIETLPGNAPHAILDLGDGHADNTPEFTVPAGA